MTDINLTNQIVTLNVNGLSITVKEYIRQIQIRFKKARLPFMWITKIYFKYKDTAGSN